MERTPLLVVEKDEIAILFYFLDKEVCRFKKGALQPSDDLENAKNIVGRLLDKEHPDYKDFTIVETKRLEAIKDAFEDLRNISDDGLKVPGDEKAFQAAEEDMERILDPKFCNIQKSEKNHE